jgi:hypothetical protein
MINPGIMWEYVARLVSDMDPGGSITVELTDGDVFEVKRSDCGKILSWRLRSNEEWTVREIPPAALAKALRMGATRRAQA